MGLLDGLPVVSFGEMVLTGTFAVDPGPNRAPQSNEPITRGCANGTPLGGIWEGAYEVVNEIIKTNTHINLLKCNLDII